MRRDKPKLRNSGICVFEFVSFGLDWWFMVSLHLQDSDAYWGHEPKLRSPWSAGVLAGVLQLENLAGKDAGAPRFMERASVSATLFLVPLLRFDDAENLLLSPAQSLQ